MSKAVCEKCNYEDDITHMDKYQCKGVIYYECMDDVSCKCREYMMRMHIAYGDLKRFNVNYEDLESLPHRCRCCSKSYRHRITGKFYISHPYFGYGITNWEEVTDPNHHDHFP